MADVYDALVSKARVQGRLLTRHRCTDDFARRLRQVQPLLLECLVEIQDVLKAEIVGRENESE